MVGLAYSNNKDELDLMLETMCHFPWQKIKTCKNINIGICTIENASEFIFENSKYSIIIDGLICNATFAEIIKFYEKDGIDFAKNLEGEFTMIFYSKEEDVFFVVTDPMVQNRCHYYFSKNRLLISTETKSIAKIIKPEFNETTIYCMIRFRKNFSDMTLFKGIQRLLPGYIIQYNRKTNQFNQIQVSKPTYNPKSYKENELVQKTAAIFKEALEQRFISFKQNAISLSGGLDSRLGAILLKDKKIKAFTFGSGNDPDSIVGTQIAGKLRIPHTLVTYDFKDEKIVNLAEFCAYIVEGGTTVANCFSYFVHSSLRKEFDIVFQFIGLDVVLGGNYLEKFREVEYKNLPMIDLIKKLAILSESESDKIFLNKPDIESVIKDHLKLVDLKNPEIAIENALLLDAMYRNSAAQQTRRDFCQVTNPVFDKKFINLIQEMPIEFRRNHKLENLILEFLDPKLAKIVSATTGLNTKSGRIGKFVMKNRKRFKKFEQIYLKREISERTYFDFDVAMRSKPWIKKYREHVINSKTVKQFLNQHEARRLLENHIGKKELNGFKLFTILSMAMSLNIFSGEKSFESSKKLILSLKR